MPTYDFINEKTGEEFQEFMSIADMEKFMKDNPHIKKAWNVAPALTGDHLMGVGPKTEAGFNENMQRIAAAHPTSALADRYGSGETNAKIKARNIVKKHISTK